MPLPYPLSIPYPPTTHPSFHGPPTGNTNFCELDYQFTPYIAELINTLTNAIYLVYAWHGLRSLRQRKALNLQTALPHIGLVAVGLGSAAFHTTLLKTPQLADEIGMAIPTGAVVARLMSFEIRDPGRRASVYAAVLGVVALVYAVHCVLFVNWIHYPAFGGMVFFVGRRCVLLMRRIEDEGVRKKVRAEVRRGRWLFLGAFGLWLVDRFYCGALMSARQWLGLPWGWLLELHGWWHIGTGMGAFVFIQVAEYLTEVGLKRDPGERLNPFKLRLWGGSESEKMMNNGQLKVKVNGATDGQKKKKR